MTEIDILRALTSVDETIALGYREIELKKAKNQQQEKSNTLVVLPCPFCGNSIEYHPKSHKINNMWNKYTVYCPKCNLTMERESALELSKAWNTRAQYIDTVDILNTIKERINDNMEVTEPHVLDHKYYRNEGREEAIDIIDNFIELITKGEEYGL